VRHFLLPSSTAVGDRSCRHFAGRGLDALPAIVLYFFAGVLGALVRKS